jgi:tetratricopeptide (TPR) repeat protein
MRKLLFALACLTLVATSATGQGVMVDYLEGKASQRADGTWSALSIGDTVSLDASVMLEEHSMLQLKGQGASFTISQPGIYGLRSLVNARAALRAAGAGTAVAVAFTRLIRGPAHVSSTAGGVRAERIDIRGLGLEEDVAPKYLEEGKRHLDAGEYEQAIEQLKQATSADERDEAGFCLATAYSLNGDPRGAMIALAGISPTGKEEWAPDLVLLRAKLLEDTLAFSPAIEVLLTQGAGLADDETRGQTFFFLLALGYRGTGDKASEKTCLEKVMAMGPETEMGTAAARLSTTR